MTALDQIRALEQGDAFAPRHIAPSEAEITEMLRVVGASSLDDLSARTVPAVILGMDLSALPPPATEQEALAELATLAAQNRADIKSLIGMGYHGRAIAP